MMPLQINNSPLPPQPGWSHLGHSLPRQSRTKSTCKSLGQKAVSDTSQPIQFSLRPTRVAPTSWDLHSAFVLQLIGYLSTYTRYKDLPLQRSWQKPLQPLFCCRRAHTVTEHTGSSSPRPLSACVCLKASRGALFIVQFNHYHLFHCIKLAYLTQG